MRAGTTALWRRRDRQRVGGEAAVGAEADQHRNGELSQSLGYLGGVIAGVEDEQRRRAAAANPNAGGVIVNLKETVVMMTVMQGEELTRSLMTIIVAGRSTKRSTESPEMSDN